MWPRLTSRGKASGATGSTGRFDCFNVAAAHQPRKEPARPRNRRPRFEFIGFNVAAARQPRKDSAWI